MPLKSALPEGLNPIRLSSQILLDGICGPSDFSVGLMRCQRFSSCTHADSFHRCRLCHLRLPADHPRNVYRGFSSLLHAMTDCAAIFRGRRSARCRHRKKGADFCCCSRPHRSTARRRDFRAARAVGWDCISGWRGCPLRRKVQCSSYSTCFHESKCTPKSSNACSFAISRVSCK